MTTAPPTEPPGSLAAERYGRQERRLHLRAGLLDVTTAVALAVSVSFFLADGGAYRFGTPDGVLTSLGIVSGLLAATAACLMLALSARVPFLDRTFGQPEALHLHHRLGPWVAGGLALHVAFLTAGYALRSHLGVVGQFADFWASTPDFGWAVLGFVLLVVVTLTSVLGALRRLPYEAWHLTHALAYVAVAASVPHQLSMGSLFYDPSPSRWYWIALYALTGGSVLAFRVVVPAWVSLRHRLTVSRVDAVGPGTVTLEVRGRDVAALGARAGQYFHWRFLAPGLWWHQHPFSLSAKPTADTLRITVRDLGRGSAALQHVRPGTRVAIEGPYGRFTEDARTRVPLVLVGAGIGITPIRALVEDAYVKPGQAAVILRADVHEELYLLDEITELCERRGVQLTVLVGPPLPGRWVCPARADLTLTDLVPWASEADVFVCGPPGFTRAFLAEARALGVPEAQLHHERFSW